MALVLVPPDAASQAAAEAAVRLTRLDAGPAPSAHGHAWLTAARAEAVEREPRPDDRYALSPRRTRGATRA